MPTLTETLRDAQRFGFFGNRPIEEAIAHSMAFVEALGEIAPGVRIVDLGSGGGLPGLVLASAYPEASVLLVDRRQKRTDFLSRAVARLRWHHVDVLCADVDDLIREVDDGARPAFDVAAARGFGPPATTLQAGVSLVCAGGCVIISEPPSGNRWPSELLDELGVTMTRAGAVSVFRT